MKKAAKLELKFFKKEQLTKDTYTLYFSRPPGFDFFAGQYLKIFLEIENPDDRGSVRYFTISSSPGDLEFLTITTRIIKSSFKLKLNSLKPGDTLNAFGPIGYFDFDPNSKVQNVFLAGGIGITPVHSILKFLNQKNIQANVILLVSFSFKEDVIFFQELNEFQKQNPNLRIIYTLTKEKKNLPGFENGRIDDNLIKKFVTEYLKSKFFITGPEEMVYQLYQMVLGLGVSEENIFKEDFPGY